jgi:hypothetical protein
LAAAPPAARAIAQGAAIRTASARIRLTSARAEREAPVVNSVWRSRRAIAVIAGQPADAVPGTAQDVARETRACPARWTVRRAVVAAPSVRAAPRAVSQSDRKMAEHALRLGRSATRAPAKLGAATSCCRWAVAASPAIRTLTVKMALALETPAVRAVEAARPASASAVHSAGLTIAVAAAARPTVRAGGAEQTMLTAVAGERCASIVAPAMLATP